MLHYIRDSLGVTTKTGKAAPRAGAKSIIGGNPPGNIYPCSPGGPNDYVYIYTSRANPMHWPRLLEAMGRADLIGDKRYDTREARIENEEEVDAIITEWTTKRDKYEAMRLVGAAGVPAGAVRDTMELLHDPDFESRKIIQTIQHPGYGEFKTVAWPVHHDGKAASVVPAPLLGEHSHEVLKDWLGMTEDQLSELNTDNVIS